MEWLSNLELLIPCQEEGQYRRAEAVAVAEDDDDEEDEDVAGGWDIVSNPKDIPIITHTPVLENGQGLIALVPRRCYSDGEKQRSEVVSSWLPFLGSRVAIQGRQVGYI